jgi:hypothetical protein
MTKYRVFFCQHPGFCSLGFLTPLLVRRITPNKKPHC